MENKTNTKGLIKRVILISLCILVSFFIIYKLSSSLFMVITGLIILLVGAFIKDPELSESKEEPSKLEQLSIFSKEVLEPAILLKENKTNKEKVVVATKNTRKKNKNKNIIDIENTNSYKFDELDKKIKKSKRVKA